MTLAGDLINAGLPAGVAEIMGWFPTTTFAATGTTQGTAAQLPANYTVITSATGGASDSVRVSKDVNGGKLAPIMIVNATSAAVNVFPSTGESINALAANAALVVAANKAVILIPISQTLYASALGA